MLQIAAARAPKRFAGLVLTNSIAYDSWPIPSVKAIRALGPLFARTPQPLFRASLATLMVRGHDNRQHASDALRLHLSPYRQHGGAGAMARQIQALDVQDTLAVAPQLASLGERLGGDSLVEVVAGSPAERSHRVAAPTRCSPTPRRAGEETP